jgi:hypothetical protein
VGCGVYISAYSTFASISGMLYLHSKKYLSVVLAKVNLLTPAPPQ